MVFETINKDKLSDLLKSLNYVYNNAIILFKVKKKYRNKKPSMTNPNKG